MTHMDAYTILYQAKSYITEDRDLGRLLDKHIQMDRREFLENLDQYQLELKALSGIWLAEGVKEIKHEFPASVSNRMENYYIENKDALLDAFSNKVKEVIVTYKEAYC